MPRSRGRAVPPRTPTRAELEEAERLAALRSGDPALVRVWASKWLHPTVNTIALADDDSLRESMAAALAQIDAR